ncbi:hypothetical protein Zmor_026955 [Zophobas morio]|uniref:Uncharacterized protein n=1 Tax=Zophobas morio TaxID=2755281 RepID=A0AA38M5Y4_9CUCU|nr:hypothetical protein Zmor_026955 [Zophobas morio]
MEDVKKIISEIATQIRDDMRESIKQLLKEWNTQLKEELKTIREELKQARDQLQEQNQEIKDKHEEWKRAKEEMGKTMDEVESQLDRMEREKRMNKVMMMGLEIGTGEQKQIMEKVTKILKEEAKVESKVKSAYKISEKVYVVEFENREEKINVMKNLKGSSVYINDDLTKTERKIQIKIKQGATKERNKGKWLE